MNSRAATSRRTGIVAVAAMAVLATGCTTPAPVAPSPVTPSGEITPATSATVPATPSSQSTPPIAMPWTDGGPMLWPVAWDDGSGDLHPRDGGVPTSALVWHGFLDATAHVVVSPKYVLYDYCVRDGRPSRVVAFRHGVIDVLALDGTVTSTIKAGVTDQEVQLAELLCRDDRSVALFNRFDSWQRIFDLSTGKRLPPEPEDSLGEGACPGDVALFPEELPAGYPHDAGGGWAYTSPDQPVYLNISTHATIAPSRDDADGLGPITDCGGGVLGFLNCLGPAWPLVFDKNGKVTPFASVSIDSTVTCKVGHAPFAWATLAGVQGYIDEDGVWHYQEPSRTHLVD